MNPAVRRTIEDLLDAVLRDFDARVPETGPFPGQCWEAPLPPPYGPRRRLGLEVRPGSDPHYRHVGARVGSEEGGYTSQGRFYGTSAELREELRGPEAVAAVERFLEPVLEELDEALEALQPLDLPLVAVDRDSALYAALDPREVTVEYWGPGKLHCVNWRLLLRSGDSWRDVGYARDQAESERFLLRSRVAKTLAAFHGLSVEEFNFRIWEGSVPERAGRVSGDEVDRSEPTVARLREICRAVILETPNQEEDLVREVRRIADRADP